MRRGKGVETSSITTLIFRVAAEVCMSYTCVAETVSVSSVAEMACHACDATLLESTQCSNA